MRCLGRVGGSKRRIGRGFDVALDLHLTCFKRVLNVLHLVPL